MIVNSNSKYFIEILEDFSLKAKERNINVKLISESGNTTYKYIKKY